jgi:hypothetical protein
LRVSTFLHLIVSPATMLTVAGEKAARLIWTVFVVAPIAAGAAASAATSDRTIRMRRMTKAFHSGSCRTPDRRPN